MIETFTDLTRLNTYSWLKDICNLHYHTETQEAQSKTRDETKTVGDIG